jgi:hypothetical protein
MTDTVRAVLLGVFTSSSCVWVGGFVAIAVVARVAGRTLGSMQRVRFFRELGRSYVLVATPALVIAVGTGAALLRGHAWDGTLIAAVLVAAALVVCLVFGVAQARRMTRVRAAELAAPEDVLLVGRVRHGARTATVLRAGIGLLSLTLIALGSLLAS